MEKILVINNDIDTMSLLKSWLEKKAYKVKYTSSHDEVAQLVNQFHPNLVLVDILQHDVIDIIKSDKVDKDIPVILMTGYTMPLQLPYHPKANDVIEKPFNLLLLEKKIERLICKSN